MTTKIKHCYNVQQSVMLWVKCRNLLTLGKKKWHPLWEEISGGGYSTAGEKQKGIRQYDHINLSTWLRLTVNTTRFLIPLQHYQKVIVTSWAKCGFYKCQKLGKSRMVEDRTLSKNLCRVQSYMFDRVINTPLKSVVISNIELIIF